MLRRAGSVHGFAANRSSRRTKLRHDLGFVIVFDAGAFSASDRQARFTIGANAH
jgi:hypothetical protein